MPTLEAPLFSKFENLECLEIQARFLSIMQGKFNNPRLVSLKMENMTALKTLDVDVFSDLSALEDLQLPNMEELTNLEGSFTHCSSLTLLNMNHMESLTTLDLSIFSSLVNLEDLKLNGMDRLTCIENTFNTPSLRRLEMNDMESLTTLDLSIFSNLEKLEQLSLARPLNPMFDQISNVTHLSQLAKLKCLKSLTLVLNTHLRKLFNQKKN